MKNARIRGLVIVAAALTAMTHAVHAQTLSGIAAWCTGDCNGDKRVTVNEIIRLIQIELGNASCSICPDWCSQMPCNIECFPFIEVVNNAMYGCPR